MCVFVLVLIVFFVLDFLLRVCGGLKRFLFMLQINNMIFIFGF